MSAFGGVSLVTSGLTLYLDAANPKSYPGTGTTWYDLTSNHYDFTVNASAFVSAGAKSYFNFSSGSMAKRVVGGALTNVPAFANATFMVFSVMNSSTSDWRTLIRGSGGSADQHPVIVQSGGNSLGMYDNNTGGGFISTSPALNVSTLSNYSTAVNMYTWKMSTSSPYYQFQYNKSGVLSTITDVKASFNSGFCSIGGWPNGSTDVTVGGQFWGQIPVVLYYNRELTNGEIEQNFNAMRGRYGL